MIILTPGHVKILHRALGPINTIVCLLLHLFDFSSCFIFQSNIVLVFVCACARACVDPASCMKINKLVFSRLCKAKEVLRR